LLICFLFSGIWYFFQLFLQLFISVSTIFIADADPSGSAIFIADAEPAMSFEALRGLPRAQATRQGSRASERAGQHKEKRSKRERKGNS
jgi:hypothetical protein